MSQELAQLLFKQVEDFRYSFMGVECWSAREVQKIFGYTRWDSFKKTITKAKKTCKSIGVDVDSHFPEISRTAIAARGTEKQIKDVLLTRYACYLVAQNGDSKIREIALAQHYFATQTRIAELAEKGLLKQQNISLIATSLSSEHKLIGSQVNNETVFIPESRLGKPQQK